MKTETVYVQVPSCHCCCQSMAKAKVVLPWPRACGTVKVRTMGKAYTRCYSFECDIPTGSLAVLAPGDDYEVVDETKEGVVIDYCGNIHAKGREFACGRVFLTHKEFTCMSGGLASTNKTIVVEVPVVYSCCCYEPAVVRLSPGMRGTVKSPWIWAKVQSYRRPWLPSHMEEKGGMVRGCGYEVQEVTRSGVELQYDGSPWAGGTELSMCRVFLTHEEFTEMSGGLSLEPGKESTATVMEHCCHCHHHCCHRPAEVQVVLSYPLLSGTVKNWIDGTLLKDCKNGHDYHFRKGSKEAMTVGCTYKVLCVSEKGVEVELHRDGSSGGMQLPDRARLFFAHEDFAEMSGGLSLKPGVEVVPCTHNVVVRIRY